MKVILVLPLDADLTALDGRLHLDAARLEDLDDLLGLVLGDPLLQHRLLPEAATRRLLRVLEGQTLGRDTPRGQLLHEDLGHGAQLVIVVGDEVQELLFAPDIGDASLEIVALADLLESLLDSVVDLLQIDLGHDVEGALGRH